MISIVACCSGAKLCAHAARDFRSQQHVSRESNIVQMTISHVCFIKILVFKLFGIVVDFDLNVYVLRETTLLYLEAI